MVDQTLTYTGAVQTVTVPTDATGATIHCAGAQGNGVIAATSYAGGGQGGEITCDLDGLTAGDTLYCYVGGRSADHTMTSAPTDAGFNGGGQGGIQGGGGGGGATDVRWPTDTIANRRIVAGGGGGDGLGQDPVTPPFPFSSRTGGSGSGADGDAGQDGVRTNGGNPGGGAGGTSSAGGTGGAAGGGTSQAGEDGDTDATGAGGDGGIDLGASDFGGGGGGGGWHGGGGGGRCDLQNSPGGTLRAAGAGGGGSGHGTGVNQSTTTGTRTGDGLIEITWIYGDQGPWVGVVRNG